MRALGGWSTIEVQIFLFASTFVKLSCIKAGAEASGHGRFSLILLQNVVRVCASKAEVRRRFYSSDVNPSDSLFNTGPRWQLDPCFSCFSAGPYYNLCRRGPTRSSQSMRMVGKWWVKERVKSEKRADFVPAVFQSFLEKGNTHKKKQLRKEQMNFQGMDAFFCNTANTTCRRTRGFCRCYVVQCRSHMKNKGTQLNDRPRPKCSPTAISQLIQTFRRWWYSIQINILYISWWETDLHIPLLSSDLNSSDHWLYRLWKRGGVAWSRCGEAGRLGGCLSHPYWNQTGCCLKKL